VDEQLIRHVKPLVRDIFVFCERGSGLTLREYQKQVASVVVESVIQKQGKAFVVLFPRQSGKNELQAQIESYLLALYSQIGAEMVKVSPTWKPQTLNAMRRLRRVLEKNLVTHGLWSKESGYIFRFDQARCFFFSGSPEANIVGATASTLLEVDEAQDIEIAKFDKDIAPMAASTNATRVFWGTAWTSRTLLARELRAAQAAQAADGQRRVFILTAPEVAAEVPAYGQFVAEQVAKLGRSNPMVRTQFFSEEIDAEGGMFPTARVALMHGSHPPQDGPQPGCIYCMLVDVAGEDEVETQNLSRQNQRDLRASLQNPGRDSTALTIVQVDLATLSDPVIKAPTYRVVNRRQWIGVKHARLYAELKALAETWRAKWLVIDATGVGAGLAGFLSNAMPGKVLPFIFNSKTKSELGWSFLGVIDSGRWKESADSSANFANFAKLVDKDQLEFFNQLSFCQFEIIPGPEKKMRWGVGDGTRDPATGELVHDDLILSAALVAVLEEQTWSITSPTVIIQAADPLAAMEEGF
jgi:hypothetical protein